MIPLQPGTRKKYPSHPHESNSRINNALDPLFKHNFAYTTKLKPDHENRPIWVCPNFHLYLETYSPVYKQSYDFLIAISDPVSRPLFIHEYHMTQYSLYAAASLGLSTNDILYGLERLCKNKVPIEVRDFIYKNTSKCGKVKLVLKNQRYYVESPYVHVLKDLMKGSSVISNARCDCDIFTAEGRKRKEKLDEEYALEQIQAQTITQQHRAALKSEDLVQPKYTYDAESGFIIEKINTEEEDIILQGTGTLDKDGNRTNARINQRAAMGMLDDQSPFKLVDIPSSSDSESDNDEYDISSSDSDKDNVYKHKNIPSTNNFDKSNLKKNVQEVLQPTHLYSFELKSKDVEAVRRESNLLGYPMLEEFDFRHDKTMDEYILPINLRPQAQIREYQEKALSKMFGNGRARSGIIVLPCGAGKTLVGITAMTTVGRSCLIVVSTGVAAQQWREQVKLWTTLPEEYIYLFASGVDVNITTKPKVVIATYSMLAYEQKRSADAQRVMDIITGSEWGLLLMDEVHVAPADKFKKCITMTHSRCKLGLTATLVREDDKVASLIEMIGPKLYEASWLDLSRQGFIATVRCYEVWCPMTPAFYQQFLRADHHLRRLLYVTNPNKYQTLEMLVSLHEGRGDKIMVFCEDDYPIKIFSAMMKRPYLMGETKDVDRLRILKNFSTSPHGDTVFISKIGDNSIDLPDTNVIIQISSHYASRRQEAQRLGRILRPKSHRSGTVDAHFYTIISQDTEEMKYATKRQRFLVDQGYAYKVLKQVDIQEQKIFQSKTLGLSNPTEQREFLRNVVDYYYNRSTGRAAQPNPKRKQRADEAEEVEEPRRGRTRR